MQTSSAASSAVSDACISVQHVSKNFGGVNALSDVSMDIPAGPGMHGVIGPNGAGKTTLFNVLTGVIPPTQGRVLVNGYDVTGMREDRIFHRGLSRTFQGVRLFAHLTVEENVGLAAGSATGRLGRAQGKFVPGWFDTSHRERMNEALDCVGLSGAVRNKYPSELTLWQSRMVEIARAISSEPSVLLLDEPGAGINTAEKARLAELLVKLSTERACRLVLVEHDMNFVMSIVEYVWVLNFGCLLAHGTPAEVQANPQVLEAYLGRPEEDAA